VPWRDEALAHGDADAQDAKRRDTAVSS